MPDDAAEEEPAEEEEQEATPLQKARMILRNNYMVFVAADEDRSMNFGYHEFRGMLPWSLQRKHGDREVHAWFDAMDLDDDTKISLHEYFLFSVAYACRIAGCSVADLFQEFDSDGSDELSETEFTEVREAIHDTSCSAVLGMPSEFTPLACTGCADDGLRQDCQATLHPIRPRWLRHGLRGRGVQHE